MSETRRRVDVKQIGTGKRPGLARWLVRLVTPEGGRGVDITCGSGSIPIAAHFEGRDFLGIDVSPEAIDIARARLAYWTGHGIVDVEARRIDPVRVNNTSNATPAQANESEKQLPLF